MKWFFEKLHRSPSVIDAILLSFFTIFITYQPYYLHHEIIMMETGIHLPNINALLHGAVPYRDFFFLRGPFELYVPAFLIKLYNMNMLALPMFYYGGTVVTLLLCVFIAKQLYSSRFILYLMVPVLVGRTFPRISYYYWGGMRYALGFTVLLFTILFLKKKKNYWIFLSGVFSALSLLTTIEAGACVILSVVGVLVFSWVFNTIDRKKLWKASGIYIGGIGAILFPYSIYLWQVGAFVSMIESIYIVVSQSHYVFPGMADSMPSGFQWLGEIFPHRPYFKYMTPMYFYIVLAGYLVVRLKKKKCVEMDSCLVLLAIYGVILFLAAFRKIEGHHFEMALQPEKILLFFILERVYFKIKLMRSQYAEQKKRIPIFVINFLILGLIGSSLGYSITRYNKRFPSFKLLGQKLGWNEKKDLSLLAEQESEILSIDRAKGMVVPRWQAEEIEYIVPFLKEHTESGDVIFTYPELGNFNFWVDRPFIGRFPIATFSWFKDDWHKELVEDFKKAKPKYVIMTNLGHRTFPEEWYFRNKSNITKFNEMTNLILNNYKPIKEFWSVSIYQRK